VLVKEDYSASWRCHRATCGFTGSFHLGTFLRQLGRSRQQQQQAARSGSAGGGGYSSNGAGGNGSGNGSYAAAQQRAPGSNGAAQPLADPDAMQALEEALVSGPMPARRRPLVRPSPSLQPLGEHPQLLAWFARLGIGQQALEAAGAMAELLDGVPMVAFPQRKGAQLANVSYLHTARCGAAHQQQLVVPPGASWQVRPRVTAAGFCAALGGVR
jgi:hypothetical protein